MWALPNKEDLSAVQILSSLSLCSWKGRAPTVGKGISKDFKKINIGRISLKKGKSILKLKTTKMEGDKSIDFRLLILKNENEKNS